VPDARLGFVVPHPDPGADGADEIAGRAVRAAAEPAAGELSEPGLNRVQPTRVRGREVNHEPGMAQQPSPDRGGLVGGPMTRLAASGTPNGIRTRVATLRGRRSILTVSSRPHTPRSEICSSPPSPAERTGYRRVDGVADGLTGQRTGRSRTASRVGLSDAIAPRSSSSATLGRRRSGARDGPRGASSATCHRWTTTDGFVPHCVEVIPWPTGRAGARAGTTRRRRSAVAVASRSSLMRNRHLH